MLEKYDIRKRRHRKIRKTVIGTAQRPRVIVFRSNVSTYVQVINDDNGKVLMSKSVNHKGTKVKDKPMALCQKMGLALAEDVKKAKIQKIVFDRNGYKYHGKVKAVAEGLREGGIKF